MLTAVLLEYGLADEVLLLVYPVPLGTGKRFFSEGAPTRTRARRHEGCVLGRRHQHLQARRATADRLLGRRAA
jgi:dihydrofolate reductase